MTSISASWVGKSLDNGRFLILETLREEGLEVVFKAWEQTTGFLVVVRAFNPSALEDHSSLKRFTEKYRALMQFQHPHLMCALHAGMESDCPYTVFPYLSGGDLAARRTDNHGKLSLHDVSSWVPQIASAIDYLHKKGWIHRDVTPTNILFDSQGQACLTGYDPLAAMTPNSASHQQLTGTGMLFGTPDYLAPELILGQNFDGKVDQFALAMTVYECLLGRLPFTGNAPAAVLVKQTTEPIPPLDRSVPSAIANVILKALSKSPEDRFSSCGAFSRALMSAIESSPNALITNRPSLAGKPIDHSESATTNRRGLQETAPLAAKPTLEVPKPPPLPPPPVSRPRSRSAVQLKPWYYYLAGLLACILGLGLIFIVAVSRDNESQTASLNTESDPSAKHNPGDDVAPNSQDAHSGNSGSVIIEKEDQNEKLDRVPPNDNNPPQSTPPLVSQNTSKQALISEPIWLPVEDLIATPGRFILELPPANGEPAAIQEDLPTLEIPADADGLALDSEAGFQREMPTLNSRGVRYVSLRGVFPVQEQLEALKISRGERSIEDVRDLVVFYDVEVQRQTANDSMPLESQHEGSWGTLDNNVTLSVLAEAADYSEDIVDGNLTNFVVTSPLPMRLVGDWTNYFVGHPRIPTMTESEAAFRSALNNHLVSLKTQFLIAELGISSKGFASAQFDLVGLQRTVLSDSSFFRQLKQSLDADAALQGMLPPQTAELTRYLAASREQVLFRYFDFDVRPGETYRYRVRLKVRNPSFNLPPEHLVSINVGDGEFRETPWSAPTKQANVPEDSKFFISHVSSGRGGKAPLAVIDLFQWLPEIGTTANQFVGVVIGQFIGQPEVAIHEKTGKAADDSLLVEVLRPYQSFKKEPLEMTTNDMVVDVEAPMLNLTRNFHSDISIRRVDPLVQMLTVNEFGELQTHNPVSQAKEHSLAKALLKYEHEPFEGLKTAHQRESMERYDEGDELFQTQPIQPGTRRGGSVSSGASSRSAPNPLRRSRKN